MNNKLVVGVVVVIIGLLIIGGVYWVWNSQHAKDAKLDVFAACIAQSGAKFYGAFWVECSQVTR